MNDQVSSSQPKAGKAVAGGLWTVSERVVSQIAQLVVFVTAARVLSPAEFGSFALASACVILLLRFAEVGWAQYIMSWAGDDEVPRQVLLIAIGSGAVMALAGAMVGTQLDVFGFTAETENLVSLFSIWILLAATSSAQKGIMIWQHKLVSSAICEILAEGVGLAVALYTLYAGYGVFSLVYGRLAMQSVHIVISFAITRKTPKMGITRDRIADLKAFSMNIFASRMILNIKTYAATFIIGGFLGPAAVGFYRAAERLVGALSEIIDVPAQVLAWSLFRQARGPNGDISGFQKQANQYFRVLMMLALPVFIWLVVVGEDLVTGLLGEEWQPALPIIAVLALARVIIVPCIATEPIMALAGQVRRLPRYSFLFFVVTVIATLIAAPMGVIYVAWAQVLVSVVVLVSLLWLTQKHGGLNWGEIFAGCTRALIPITVATVVLWGIHASPTLEAFSPLLRITFASVPVLVLVLYAVMVSLMEPELRSKLLRRIQSVEET